MFDQNFMAGLIVLFASLAGAIWIASSFGLDPTIALVGVAVAAYALFAWLERRMRNDLPPAKPAIFVPWGDKLNETDFRPDAPETNQSLVDLGLTVETAQYQKLVFETRNPETDDEIRFEGFFVRDPDGSLVIRSTEPV